MSKFVFSIKILFFQHVELYRNQNFIAYKFYDLTLHFFELFLCKEIKQKSTGFRFLRSDHPPFLELPETIVCFSESHIIKKLISYLSELVCRYLLIGRF